MGLTKKYLEFVSAEDAGKGFKQLIRSVGAKLGTTRRVIITDGGDYTNAEWEFGKGITFPPPQGSTNEDAVVG